MREVARLAHGAVVLLLAMPARADEEATTTGPPHDFEIHVPPRVDEDGPALEPRPRRVLGTVLPPMTLSTRHDVWWAAPRGTTAFAVTEGVGQAEEDAETLTGRVRVFAQAALGPLTLDAMFHTRPLTDPSPRRPSPVPPGSTLWAGLRAQVIETDDQDFAFGLYSRPGFGVGDEITRRWDAGFTWAGAATGWTWGANLGCRYRYGGDVSNTDVLVFYTASGATFELAQGVRGFVQPVLEGLIVGDRYEADLDFGLFGAAGLEIRRGPLLFMPYVSTGRVFNEAFGALGWIVERGLNAEIAAHLAVGVLPELD